MKQTSMYLFIILLVASLPVFAQNTPNTDPTPLATPVALPIPYTLSVNNYIRTWEPKVANTDTGWVSSTVRNPGEVKQGTKYFDGLGRPLQTVMKGISPIGNDMVSPIIYDAFGRELLKYLPYVQQDQNKSDGNFKLQPFASQQNFYNNSSLNPGVAGQTIYYSLTDYEASPLNRELSVYAAGNSWAKGTGHGVTHQYMVNSAADSVEIWTVSLGGGSIPQRTGEYSAGQLSKLISTDENGNTVIEYKDESGNLILRKVQQDVNPTTGHMGWLCTYYVYDDLNQLVFVIPPQAVLNVLSNWNLTPVAKGLCFSNRYDNNGRVIEKSVPDGGVTEMVYDVRDRLVLIRDANLRTAGDWIITFYDAINRPVETAIYTPDASSNNRQALQYLLNNQVNTTQTNSFTVPGIADLVVAVNDRSLYQATNSVTLAAGFESGVDAIEVSVDPYLTGVQTTVVVTNPIPNIPAAQLQPLTFTYYDDYTFAGNISFDGADTTSLKSRITGASESIKPTILTKGLATGALVKVLGTSTWLPSTTYYDDKARTVQIIQQNHIGGEEILTTCYGFTGEVLGTILKQTNPRSGVMPGFSTMTLLDHDMGGRLIGIRKRINEIDSLDRTIAQSVYDELGNLKDKQLGVNNGVALEEQTMEYNIRGWLQSINKEYVASGGIVFRYFGQVLSYDYGFNNLQYNGNISGVKWRGATDAIARAYGYGYDKANRLTSSYFTQQNSEGAAWTQDQIDFSVSGLNYDINGNIKSMKQMGMASGAITMVDNLAYTYTPNSNSLLSVVDAGGTAVVLGDFKNGQTGGQYSYDSVGNLKIDPIRGISEITYNHLNLPEKITIPSKGEIIYTYDAIGKKLSKKVTDNTVSPQRITVTDYLTGLVYENDSLRYASHEEGRIRIVNKAGEAPRYVYDYFVKDHIGNIRLVLTENNETSLYAATMETAAATTEKALFSNVDNTRTPLPVGYPTEGITQPNSYTAKLNADNGQKVGPSIVLRVMAGDVVKIGTTAFYKSNGSQSSTTTKDQLLTSLINAFGGTATDAAHGASADNTSAISNLTSSDLQHLIDKSPDQNLSDKPKAYLNYILFDDQFKMVDGNSGIKQVQGTADQLQTLTSGDLPINKSGFLYIYTSNETAQDVYFDNLIITHTPGPILEETHYYPFGLTMAGISSTALLGMDYWENRLKYNGNELQSKEFLDGSGLEVYDFNARTFDPQIGRFLQIDPLIENGEQEGISPYHFAKNNPVKYNDPDGKCPNCLVGAIVGFVADAVIQVSASVATSIAKGEPVTLSSVYRDFSVQQSLAATASGAITSGMSSLEEASLGLTAKVVGVNASLSVWRQEASTGSVNLSELTLDALPVPEGKARTLVNTSSAEKSLKQAENSVKASTSQVPERKITAVQEGKSTLNNQNKINGAYNMTREGIKGNGGKTVVNETRKVVESPNKTPVRPVSTAPVSDNTRVIRPLTIR